ncbi:hypothetical protein [Clostridium thailandense]|uniref:GAP1-N2 domain-containing protein n=1 Tax=Clostridium thailandense TaxID=2794346 RepID=UPI00398999A8
MIEQHYYTRERKGIYSKTPGYDTIAKSNKLEDEFIIGTLHDLCFYEIPASLAGEENGSKYPVSLFCVNTEDNRMILGQSVFCGKDYTGQRNRYFTHNYVISEDERNEYIENPEKIIFSGGFVSDYDINKGSVISQVLKIKENREKDCFGSINELFSSTNLCKETFLNLIRACFDIAKHKKKIYIVLDSNLDNMEILAKGILKYLYRALPFDLRKRIGFITYMKEPKNKELINIVFLCKGSIKRINTELKSGYIFNIADNNFHLEGIDEEEHIFLDFIMDNIENKQKLNEFFYKAQTSIDDSKLDIRCYDNILNPLSLNPEETMITEENEEECGRKYNTDYEHQLKDVNKYKRKIYGIYKKINDFILKIKTKLTK